MLVSVLNNKFFTNTVCLDAGNELYIFLKRLSALWSSASKFKSITPKGLDANLLETFPSHIFSILLCDCK